MTDTWRFTDQSDEFMGRLMDAGLRAVQAAGEGVLEESNRTVPVLNAVLIGSGSVEAGVDEEGRLAVVVSYDTPYAVRQHEDLTLRHHDGQGPLFLQHAGDEHGKRALEAAAEQLGKELG